jgi:fatty-acyl-CoA synthase
MPEQRPTIGSLLRDGARDHGPRPFIKDERGSIGFAAFDAEVDRFAAGLLRLGIGRGDHVAIWLPNGRDWIRAFCAAARIGAVIVPVNTRYKLEEARYVIAQSDAKALVMMPGMWRTDFYAMLCDMAPGLAAGTPSRIDVPELPALRTVVLQAEVALPGTITAADLMAGAPAEVAAAEAAVRPADLLLICYTSGTTGKPKGVMHSHHVIRQATRVGTAMQVEPGDRVMAHMPFYHSAGLFMALIPALALGATLVPMVQWDTKDALRLIAADRVTMFGGIPTHFYDMVAALRDEPTDTSSLKAAWIGGSAVMQETFESIKRTLGLERLLSTYGMTENTISTSFNAWDDPVEVCCRNKAPLLSDCEVRIVHPETLAVLPPGQDGEVWCRGDTVMIGYYKDPEATRATVTPDGWLRTGDIGNLDENRYLTITSRLKEMLKIGGTNASPIEIEQHLAAHPAIRSSVVVGAPDERLGQVAFAFVELNPGSTATGEEIVRFCKDRMADYKVPRHVAFVTEFPRTATGKIQRAVLAKQAEAQLTG